MLEAKDIDLNLLVVFQEIYQERQISAVAKRLGLSQPAVSNALARLRRHFADDLFVRTAQGMQPTTLAEQLSEPIALSLAHITQALNRQSSFEPQTSQRQFSIAMTDVGEIYFMPDLLHLLQQHAPQLRLNIVRANSIDLKAELESGRIDLALGAFDDVSEAWFQRALFKQHYVCLLRQQHPLAGQELSLKNFCQLRHVIVTATDNPYAKVNQHLEKAGIVLAQQLRIPHFMSVPYILAQHDLCATVPLKLAQSAASAFQLCYTKPPLRLPVLHTHMYWHRRYNQDSGNSWLRALISQHFVE